MVLNHYILSLPLYFSVSILTIIIMITIIKQSEWLIETNVTVANY